MLGLCFLKVPLESFWSIKFRSTLDSLFFFPSIHFWIACDVCSGIYENNNFFLILLKYRHFSSIKILLFCRRKSIPICVKNLYANFCIFCFFFYCREILFLLSGFFISSFYNIIQFTDTRNILLTSSPLHFVQCHRRFFWEQC